ncbi:MAG: AI-2E family transporter [Alphaproteobacteria bacterium GM7ARS4]|nr:AI-2E family transporter [Alphaproteobacteria bacterium GM7ARS4]
MMLQPSMRLFLLMLFLLFLPFFFISVFHAIALPFVVGAVLAYLLDPLVDMLETWGMSRVLSTLLVMACFLLFFVLVVFLLFPPFIEQAMSLAHTLPRALTTLHHLFLEYGKRMMTAWDGLSHNPSGSPLDRMGWMGQWEAWSETSVPRLFSFLTDMLVSLFEGGRAFFQTLMLLLLTPLTTFYLLRDYHIFMGHLAGLLPRRDAVAFRKAMEELAGMLAGVGRGVLMVVGALSLFYGVSLTLLGLPHSVALGVVSGVSMIIPYLGWFIALSITCLVGWIEGFGVAGIGWILAIFALGYVVESFFLTPRFVSHHGGFHPLGLLFALLAGGVFLGFIGVLLAPLWAVIAVVLTRLAVAAYKETRFYTTTG